MKKQKTYRWESFKIRTFLFITKPYWKYKAKHETDVEKKLEAYLKSIGGLKNGFYENRPPIISKDFFDISKGWFPLVHELIEKIITMGWDKEICQVKQKFGGLRFYINAAPNEIHKVIHEYEVKSFKTCEHCGKTGKLCHHGRWLTTLCEDCMIDGDVPHEEWVRGAMKIEKKSNKKN